MYEHGSFTPDNKFAEPRPHFGHLRACPALPYLESPVAGDRVWIFPVVHISGTPKGLAYPMARESYASPLIGLALE